MTPTPAEIVATHHIRSYQYPAVLCGCGQEPELNNPPKVDFFAGAELLRALLADHVIAALSEHYHLLPKAGLPDSAIVSAVDRLGNPLFSPESLQDIKDRLKRIHETPCQCDESPHMNALHDLIHDDVPVLLEVLEPTTTKEQGNNR
ncbi:hypothetical protein SEA_GRANDSLAM_64 [Gordonia phage GrandSlam]|nr:hypothetical protein SEA_CHOP_64 [Gordonia phage Chop]UXL91339.1 hypothetical protein SEA_GRANDSLAM_64 [Gordonia phage GrandSlam]